MDIVYMFREMIFHVLAITFNTKTGFWNYEMTTCYNAVFIYFYFYFYKLVSRDNITASHDAPKWICIIKMNLKLLLISRNTEINSVLIWITIFERKKNLLALIIFSPHQFENALFVHPNVDLMAYFIASKCFAAKTGFPNRLLDVAQSGFSNVTFLF